MPIRTLLLCFVFCLSSAVFAAEPIKIGTIYGETGVATVNNELSLRGVKLAVQQINAAGGLLGRPIELNTFDNQSTPLGSLKAAQEAIAAGVVAIVGPAWSSHSLVVGPALQKAGIPMVSDISTHPDVTKDKPYVFRICFMDDFQGQVMAQFAHDTLNVNTAVLLINVGSEYSIGLANMFAQAFEKHGGKVLWQGEYREKQVDFAKILQKVVDIAPDVIYLPGYSRDSGLIIRQARDLGIQAQFLGGDGWSDGELQAFSGQSADGAFFTTHWHPEVSFTANQNFKTAYQATYNESIPSAAELATGYDAMMVLADAIKRAGTAEPAAIRDALATTQAYDGVTGPITLDAEGNPVNKAAVILQVKADETMFFALVQPETVH